MTIELRIRPADEVDAATLYAILRLRNEVFIVEQNAAYDDIDGRDLEPGAELLWAEEAGVVLATARILVEPAGLRIGRVATAASARGLGLASDIMRRAVERCRERDASAPIELGAQKHLAPWYSRFGFEVSGPEYSEDDIPHVPMRLGPAGSAS